MTVLPLPTSYAAVFGSALRGARCDVIGLEATPRMLPVADWTRPVDAGDRALLAQCRGETLDIGCGPGRMTRALAESGHTALGIDVVPEAVRLSRARGGVAILRDVFDAVPGEGRWATALLADGNIGIGGDPHALLVRVRALLADRGRVVVDLAPPGVRMRTRDVRLQTDRLRSRAFRWSVVGVDAIGALAVGAGLRVLALHSHGDRWFAVLEKRPR
jgi:SAM-dependent methyltransferase